MSKTPLRRSSSNLKNNSKIIIVSKGRLISAKSNVNFITLQEGDLKLTTEINNISLNKDAINKAVNNIKSQNLQNSKSNTNINKNEQDDNSLMKSSEKKYLKILYKQNQKNKYKIKPTKTDNFIETTGNIKNHSNNKQNHKIKIKELKINKSNNSNKDDIKSSNNIDANDNITINEKIEDKMINNNKDDNNETELKMKILDIIDLEKNNENEKNNKMKYNNNIIEENLLDSKEVFIEGKTEEKNEIKKKLSSQEMSINNNDFEELKHIYMDSSRSKENTIPLNNNLIDKSNHKTKLSKNENLGSKSEISVNKNQMPKGGSAIVNLGDSIKGNYIAQNLITEMEGDEISNKDSEKMKMKNDLISDDKTIKVDEDEKEEQSFEKDKEKILNDDLEEKKNNENIKINKTKIPLMRLNNNKIKNETDDNNKNQKNRSLNSINIHMMPNIYNMCFLCEHNFPTQRLFSSECNQHFLCKKCAKYFYEEIIENGNKELVCPLIKCRKPVDIEKLRDIINEEHFNIITNNNIEKNQNYLLFSKFKTDTVPENMELYSEKHVLDINTNKKFFNFNNNNIKETYCSNCNKYTLFPKSNSHFFKCLYCESKKCRYCSKNFTKEHFELNSPNHCKVYYRTDIEPKKMKCIFYFLTEVFFIFASFFLCFVGAFLLIKTKFYIAFNLKENKNFIKYFFLYLFTIICFVIVIPFIYIFFPVFPSVIALFG